MSRNEPNPQGPDYLLATSEGSAVISVADGRPRPRWRGRLHLIGLALALGGGPALLWLGDSVKASLALLVYVASLIALFGTSASYHLLARSDRAQRLMRRLDHSMIFVLIAGTYTPVCLLALPSSIGHPLLLAIWASAAVGMALKLLGSDFLLKASNALYLILGWLAIVALPAIVRHLTSIELSLLVLGGVMYTLGAVLFYCKRPRLRPSIFGYHEVWHLFTVMASVSHFGMVWLLAG